MNEKGKRTYGFRCFECNAPAHHAHHVVPCCLGGTRTVPLCETCHSKADNRPERGSRQKRLVRAGLLKARLNGVTLGRPRRQHSLEEILTVSITSTAKAADILGVSTSTVKRLKRKLYDN
jgi:hypothetical protein